MILAFDTSTEVIAIGVAVDPSPDFVPDLAQSLGLILRSESITAKRCANERLLNSASAAMSACGLGAADVSTVVCGRGPGSFTGVRIGVATAKGIASALGCPLSGASTLDAIAWEAWAAGFRGALGVVGDALRKEVYPVRYDVSDLGARRRDPDNVDKPDLAAERWARAAKESGQAVAFAGDGLAKFGDVFERAFGQAGASFEVLDESRWAVTGQGLLLAHFASLREGDAGTGDPNALLPVYTRLSDAEENERARKAKGLPMRGVLVNPVDFVEKSDSPGGLDPSSSADIPADGVAPAGELRVSAGNISDPAALEAKALADAYPLILAIETSCDETAAAIVDGRREMVADLVASQIDFHKRFGGVVPEIASRKHTEAIVGVVQATMENAGEALGLARPLRWDELDAIAVTQGPGLIGALVVGMAFAKGASWAAGLPLIGVNHLEGHIYANRIVNPDIAPPMVVSLLSGGHTMLVHVRDWGDYEILGQTVDDAVGEAYDKVAKALGLGYPGGPVISRYAAQGDATAIDFPRAMLHSHDYRFSLSGLKTAVMTYIKGEVDAGHEINVPDLAASFQRAVIDVQVAKALAAVKETGVREFCLGGGVAANPELRSALTQAMEGIDVHVTLPAMSACTDNAGMIAEVAFDAYSRGDFLDLSADSMADMPLER